MEGDKVNCQCGQKNIYCSGCGRLLVAASLPHSGWRPFENSQRTIFDNADIALEQPGKWQKSVPIDRLIPRDVTTAAYDAAVWFGLITIGGLSACWYFSVSLAVAPTSGFVAALIVYFCDIRFAKGQLKIDEIVTVEETKEKANSSPVQLEITQRDEAGVFQRLFRFSLPQNITEEKFSEWCKGVLPRPDLTQARWVGRKKNQFSRADYVELLALLDEAGIIQRQSEAKNASYELTKKGRKGLSHYVGLYSRSLTHSHVL